MEEDLREEFKQNLIRLINNKKCSRQDIADYMRVSLPTVHSWVNGQKIPRMDKIDRLASFFGCSRTELLYKKAPVKDEGLEKSEADMLKLFHLIPEESRDMVLGMIEAALKSQGLL